MIGFSQQRCRIIAALYLTAIAGNAAADEFPTQPTAWPVITETTKPWTRWWWLGSGVDAKNLTRELEAFAQAGIGGVEICPIYQAVGAEDRSLDFLTPEWMEALAHTTREAVRLGMGVDMTTGTGWPFGGPMVTDEMASAGVQRISEDAKGGEPFSIRLPEGDLAALRAFSSSGEMVDLMDQANEGSIQWTPPAGEWRVEGIVVRGPLQKVKRAAPGGAGWVLDPYSPKAINQYLANFDKAYEGISAPKPRAQFHDSFEYYEADWTPDLFEKFQAARGYDLRDQLVAFNGQGDTDIVKRVRADYRQTLGELHHDYLKAWHDWTQSRGGVTRNQAHGSPGNLLDHYAVSEIPETEIFKHVADDQIPLLRFAVSAAHANGGTLASCETFTWLDEHFQVTPEQLKEAADFVFLGGVNHVFFHGIPYSPDDAKWPGWLFYASTHMGPNGGLWRNLPAFTGYLQRCQSVLQHGKPSSEVLLYFPYADLLHDGVEKPPLFTIHNPDQWLHPTPFFKTAMELWESGVTFDYTSDDLLAKAVVKDGVIHLGGNAFKLLVLPGVKHMPDATLQRVFALADAGGKVLVQGGWPENVPGFHDFEKRRNALKSATGGEQENIAHLSGSIVDGLGEYGMLRERMTDAGLRFIRRQHDGGYHYFIVNRSKETFEGNLPLAVPFKSAVILDPWNPQSSHVVTTSAIPLRLVAGESIILRTFTDEVVEGERWNGPLVLGKTVTLDGPWTLDFIEGGPVLPKATQMKKLVSWTTLEDEAAIGFSGTARYSIELENPAAEGEIVRLDLGKVGHTAKVSVNGDDAGVSWSAPHVVDLTNKLKSGTNKLTIEVTNLAANRIADLDRRKVDWKRFHEINFVNIEYKPFDASNWKPLDSGLIGPVRLMIGSQNSD